MRDLNAAQVADGLFVVAREGLQPWTAARRAEVIGVVTRAFGRPGVRAPTEVQALVDKITTTWQDRVAAYVQSDAIMPTLDSKISHEGTTRADDVRLIEQSAQHLRALGWEIDVSKMMWSTTLTARASLSMISEAKERRLDRASDGPPLPIPVRLDPAALHLKQGVWMVGPAGERLVMPAYTNRVGHIQELRPEGSRAYRVPPGLELPAKYAQVPGFVGLMNAEWIEAPVALLPAWVALRPFVSVKYGAPPGPVWQGNTLIATDKYMLAGVQGVPEGPERATVIHEATPPPCLVAPGFSLTATTLTRSESQSWWPLPAHVTGCAALVDLVQLLRAARSAAPSKGANLVVQPDGQISVRSRSGTWVDSPTRLRLDRPLRAPVGFGARSIALASRFLRREGLTALWGFGLSNRDPVHLLVGASFVVLGPTLVDVRGGTS